MEILNSLGHWIRPYLGDIALAIVATFLVIYGNEINKVVKRNIGKKALPIRFIVFVVLCTIGYGFVTVHVTRWVGQILSGLPTHYIPLAVLFSLLTLAFLAERKNQM